LHNTCLDLTRGQYLDMSYEERNDLTLEDYWPMIAGKTSALLAACTELGALLGNAHEDEQKAFRLYGYHVGLAFQVQDDILGIWGDEALTGKSAASDLVEGKNSFPILYALGKKGRFAERWRQGPITAAEVETIAQTLEKEGGREHAELVAAEETRKALSNLELANPRGPAAGELLQLTNKLLGRKQ
jgi:geranylgeranyl diphosphate synthase type I